MDDQYWMTIAYRTALSYSADNSTQNGAVIVSMSAFGKPVAKGWGANKLPVGVSSRNGSHLEKPDKYDYLIHAEADAIAYAARTGSRLSGSKMYCPWAACPACANLIVQAGIKRLVTHKTVMDLTPDRWKEQVEIGRSILSEAGVELVNLDCKIGGMEILFNGQIISP